jgi:hypothetical protein
MGPVSMLNRVRPHGRGGDRARNRARWRWKPDLVQAQNGAGIFPELCAAMSILYASYLECACVAVGPCGE